MSRFLQELSQPAWVHFGWALIHMIWQGLIIGALLEIALLFVSRKNAAGRYLMCGVALVLMPVCLFITYGFLDISTHGETIAMFSGDTGAPASSVAPAPASALPSSAHRASADLIIDAPRPFDLTPWMPTVVVLWLIGVLLLGVRKLGAFYVIGRLRRRGLAAPTEALREQFRRACLRLGIDPRRVCLKISSLVTVPMTMGWLKPIILLPASLLSGLTAGEIELLLAHELAHIRRHDYLVNLLQTVVETLFFYHPVTWWISRRMRQERENACDDLIARDPVEILTYARMLLRLEDSRRSGSWLACGADGGSLLQRVQRLAGENAPRPSVGLPAVVAVIGFAIALFALPWAKAQGTSSSAKTIPSISDAEARQKGIAAMVNGKPILWTEVYRQSQMTEKQLHDHLTGEELDQGIANARANVIKATIDRALIVDKFKQDGRSIDEAFINESMGEVVKTQYGGDRNLFLAKLKEHGSSLNAWEEEVRNNVIVGHMRNRNVWQVVQQYYQDNIQLFPCGDKINISVIQIESSSPTASKGTINDKSDRRAELARQIWQKVKAGADFATFAKQYPDLGFGDGHSYWVTRDGEFSGVPGWLPIQWAALEKMHPGETTDVIKVNALSPPGTCSYYIVRVNDRRTAHVPDTEVTARQEEESYLLNAEKQKVQKEWIDDLRANAVVQVFDDPTLSKTKSALTDAASPPSTGHNPSSLPADSDSKESHTSLEKKLDSIRLGDLKLNQVSYEELLSQISTMTRNLDPEKKGISFDILMSLKPSGASTTTLSGNFGNQTVRQFLEGEASGGCFQYAVAADAVKAWWISEAQASLRIRMTTTPISVDFQQTDVLTALKSLQAEATAHGFDLAMNVDALKGITLPSITLKLNSISLNEAFHAVCYLAHLQVTPWNKQDTGGFDLLQGPSGELPPLVFVKMEMQGYTFKHRQNDPGQEARIQSLMPDPSAEALAREQLVSVGNATTLVWGSPVRSDFYPFSGTLNLPLVKDDSGSNAALSFRFFSTVKDDATISISGGVGIINGDGITDAGIWGEWRELSGTSVLMLNSGHQALNEPLTRAVNGNDPEYLMVARASLVDQYGKDIVPPSARTKTVEWKLPFLSSK